EREEAVVIASRNARAFEEGHRHQDDEDAGDQQEDREEDGVGVEREGAVEGDGLLPREERRHDGRDREADHRHPAERCVVVDEEAEPEQYESEDRGEADRQDREPVDGGERERRLHHTPPAFVAAVPAVARAARAAWSTGAAARACAFSSRATIPFTEGSIVFKNGAGYTPITTIIATTGTSTAISRGWRSSSAAFSSWRTGPNTTRWNIQSM